jgi:hypothetical protein
VSLYIFYPSHGSFYLPPVKAREQAPLYVPYWRFRGMRFRWKEKKVTHNIIDFSTQASRYHHFPGSLHFRTQVFKMRFVEPQSKGAYLPLGLAMEDIMGRRESIISAAASQTADPQLLNQLSPLGSNGDESYQAFIGDVTSLIYAPYYRQDDGLYDGLAEQRLPAAAGELDVPETSERNACEYRFFPTLCPNCGWDMACEKDSLILLCSNCNGAWSVSEQGLQRESFLFYSDTQRADIWIPFWRLGVDCTGMELESYADFIRLTNFPRVVHPWMEQREFRYWVPAFKLNPSQFLHLGNHMMVREREEDFTDNVPHSKFHPVTLPATEGFQSTPFLLGATGYAKKKLLPQVRESDFHLRSQDLVYVPFVRRGTEYVQQELNFSLNANALRWGRNI